MHFTHDAPVNKAAKLPPRVGSKNFWLWQRHGQLRPGRSYGPRAWRGAIAMTPCHTATAIWAWQCAWEPYDHGPDHGTGQGHGRVAIEIAMASLSQARGHGRGTAMPWSWPWPRHVLVMAMPMAVAMAVCGH